MSEREQLPIREARAGNPEAWDALFKRYQLPLYVYVFELVHNEQTSLDIVQESFINAASYISSLREDDKFGSWLFGIAHQKCISHWRKKRLDTIPIEPETNKLASRLAKIPAGYGVQALACRMTNCRST